MTSPLNQAKKLNLTMASTHSIQLESSSGQTMPLSPALMKIMKYMDTMTLLEPLISLLCMNYAILRKEVHVRVTKKSVTLSNFHIFN